MNFPKLTGTSSVASPAIHFPPKYAKGQQCPPCPSTDLALYFAGMLAALRSATVRCVESTQFIFLDNDFKAPYLVLP